MRVPVQGRVESRACIRIAKRRLYNRHVLRAERAGDDLSCVGKAEYATNAIETGELVAQRRDRLEADGVKMRRTSQRKHDVLVVAEATLEFPVDLEPHIAAGVHRFVTLLYVETRSVVAEENTEHYQNSHARVASGAG